MDIGGEHLTQSTLSVSTGRQHQGSAGEGSIQHHWLHPAYQRAAHWRVSTCTAALTNYSPPIYWSGV